MAAYTLIYRSTTGGMIYRVLNLSSQGPRDMHIYVRNDYLLPMGLDCDCVTLVSIKDNGPRGLPDLNPIIIEHRQRRCQ